MDRGSAGVRVGGQWDQLECFSVNAKDRELKEKIFYGGGGR